MEVNYCKKSISAAKKEFGYNAGEAAAWSIKVCVCICIEKERTRAHVREREILTDLSNMSRVYVCMFVCVYRS